MRLRAKYVIRSPLYAFFITTIVCNVSANELYQNYPESCAAQLLIAAAAVAES